MESDLIFHPDYMFFGYLPQGVGSPRQTTAVKERNHNI